MYRLIVLEVMVLMVVSFSVARYLLLLLRLLLMAQRAERRSMDISYYSTAGKCD